MFSQMFRTSTAVAAGVALAGAVLVAPGVAVPVVGRAAAWGSNNSGQLGNDSPTAALVPVAVDTFGVLGGTLTGISAGGSHSCAVADGRAYCWGENASGQLGNDSTTDASVPVAVNALGVLAGRTVTAISAGGSHSCAVADGRAYCWGENASGQLGNNSTNPSTVPVAVNTSGVLAGKTVTAASAGRSHTCVVADGGAYCWGANGSGRLGNSSTAPSTVPVAVISTGVLAGKTIVEVSAGSSHTCAVADAWAFCWGFNASGQLGVGGVDINPHTVPLVVDPMNPGMSGKAITAVSAGVYHTCAVADGRPYCWGDSYGGFPVAVNSAGVLAGKTLTAISAGGTHTCAVADGAAYCWGANGSGQLGNNSTIGQSEPVAVSTSGILGGKTVTTIDAGNDHTAAMFAAAPQPPIGVTGTSGERQVTVAWTPPADDGGSPILDYTATATPGGATCSTTGTTCTITGLTNGTSYTLTVTARNGIGVSAPSASSASVTTMAEPQPPTSVTAVAGDRQVTASWSPPGDDGGSPVLDYTATANPGGATCTTSGLSCVVSDLVNGTPYTFTVTARNTIGTSPPSTPSAPVIPSAPVTPVAPTSPTDPPVKVTGVTAKVGKGTVKLTWKAVAEATSYQVRISKPGGKKYKAWKTTTKRVFKTTVKKGKKYRFQVAAVNASGRGPTTTIRFKGK